MNKKKRAEEEGYLLLLGFEILHIFQNGVCLCIDEDNVIYLIDGDKVVTFNTIDDFFHYKNDKIKIECLEYTKSSVGLNSFHIYGDFCFLETNNIKNNGFRISLAEFQSIGGYKSTLFIDRR